MKRMRFEGLTRPVVFERGADALLEPLSQLLAGWHWTVVGPDGCEPLIRIQLARGHFTVHSPFMPHPVVESDPLRAASHLAVDLIEAWLLDHPQQLCLHGGAARFGDRLVVFPARARAGKSTLMARLAAQGVPILTDDVLPTRGANDEIGWTFGMATRLRWPLPAGVSGGFRRFVDRHATLGDSRSRYLLPPAGQAARFGDGAPIGALVLLERSREPMAARLERASPGDGLVALIQQNLAPAMAAEETLDRLHRLVARLPCYRLHHSGVDGACRALMEAFPSAWLSHEECAPMRSADVQPQRFGANARPGFDHHLPLCRANGVLERPVQGELFLVHPRTQGIHRLNPMACGIWHLLEEPATAHDVVSVLCEAFPKHPPEQIEHEVLALLQELLDQSLLTCSESAFRSA